MNLEGPELTRFRPLRERLAISDELSACIFEETGWEGELMADS
jgi:hypothetical protein